MSMPHLSIEELDAEGGELLPDKEVLSVLDLFVNLDISLDLAAPIDLAVAANANVAAAVDAAASANILSFGSTATALAQQGVGIDQYISGEAIAFAPQDAAIDQTNDVVDGGTTGGDTTGVATTDPTAPVAGDGGQAIDTGTGGGATGDATAEPTAPVGDDGGAAVDTGGTVDGTVGDATAEPVAAVTDSGLLDGPLLNVNVDAAIDADLAAPVAGAVAANANVAAPIDAAVAANVASFGSDATALANQTAIIHQSLDGVTASATADQNAEIQQ